MKPWEMDGFTRAELDAMVAVNEAMKNAEAV